ncbi:MAG: hypothetical protein ACD_7C00150G0003 [uncultured bacterium]|nr:MAG: hypothetical protein ACD_7C00150G0003 [uncultured bacterium]HBR79973.1 hypothetical protein [Candidatus Moranbacteria bacterium]
MENMENNIIEKEHQIEEKINKIISESQRILDENKIDAYKSLTVKMADYLVSQFPNNNFLLVLDGLTGSGKSTFCAYLLAELKNKGRMTPNWLELDDFLKSPEERMLLLERIKKDHGKGLSTSKNQYRDNYRFKDVLVFFQKLKKIVADKNSSPKTDFFDFGLDKYSGEKIVIPFILGRDILVENEYGVYFSDPIQNLNPICIRINSDFDKAKINFINRTKIKYGDKQDVSEGSPFMQKRELLFLADLETYKELAKKTAGLINIVVDLSEQPKKWAIRFLNSNEFDK